MIDFDDYMIDREVDLLRAFVEINGLMSEYQRYVELEYADLQKEIEE